MAAEGERGSGGKGGSGAVMAAERERGSEGEGIGVDVRPGEVGNKEMRMGR